MANRTGNKKRSSLDKTFYREAVIEPANIDTKNRIVPVSFSSDQPVQRYWWDGEGYNEILGHAQGNADLTRLGDIGVALFNHDPAQPIGKVLTPMIDSKAMRGTAAIRFDTDEASDVIYQKVLSGTLKGVSVGYRVTDWETVKEGETSTDGLYQGPCEIARSWEPFEISIVSVPADATVGVGRSMDDLQQLIQKAVAAVLTKRQKALVPFRADEDEDDNEGLDEDLEDDEDEGWDDEEDRDVDEDQDNKLLDEEDAEETTEDTEDLHLECDYLAGDECSQGKCPVDGSNNCCLNCEEQGTCEDACQPKTEVLRNMKKNNAGRSNAALQVVRKQAAKAERVRVMEIRAMFRSFREQTGLKEDTFIDNGVSVEKARKALMTDIAKRKSAPVIQTPEIRVIADDEDKFRAAAIDALVWRSGLKVAKPAPGFESLRCVNMVDLGRLVYERSTGKRFDSFDRDLLVREMVQSSVISNILQNVADKAMQNAYQLTPVTYPMWTKHGVLNDYKPALRAQLSEVPLLENVGKGAEYKLITLTDAGEWIQLSKRGNLFTITREDILNDDMHALVDFPARWATAARMTINQDVYQTLTANPKMGYDNTPIFDPTHNNIATTLKKAPSKDSLQAAIQAMMLQTGLKTATPLNIRPKFMLTPVALMFASKQLLQSAADPAAPNAGAVNVLHDIVTMITDPLLDVVNPSAWYLAADPAITDTIEVAFLNGQDTPYIEQQSGFQVDGFTYKIRIEYGVKALDWRGLYMNPGK
ncbi:prohead serine protease [Anaerospora hongkongensis]|uniref:Prohead serine protease n=1 Tax=Anaerospora hongkongensis TaxID=244830 RepID=A0A4R1PZY4_9FIRM|nr:HK97 family phage prohead protease [Anaerospora hongkongensis]TCL37251.1 prohead serine protease [Anaerospora hongkongensis]